MLGCFSPVWLSATLWTVALWAPLSMGFSRHDCWSGLPFPPPGDHPDTGIESAALVLWEALYGNYHGFSPASWDWKTKSCIWTQADRMIAIYCICIRSLEPSNKRQRRILWAGHRMCLDVEKVVLCGEFTGLQLWERLGEVQGTQWWALLTW